MDYLVPVTIFFFRKTEQNEKVNTSDKAVVYPRLGAPFFVAT
jgi:hypothetical protein